MSLYSNSAKLYFVLVIPEIFEEFMVTEDKYFWSHLSTPIFW